jgi:anion-transporting  ArsA/GET3 family ATPase
MSARPRIHFMAGKGGVGRTTVSAALAVALAREGGRVLLTEMDEATTRAVGEHPALAATLGLEGGLSPEPRRVLPGVDAARLCSATGHEAFLRGNLPGGAVISAALRSRPVRRFLESGPSFHELGQLAHLAHLAAGQVYTDLVVDLPATGHALALVRLPASLRRIISTGPVARALDRMSAAMRDPKVTVPWLVTLPETLPVSETLELAAALSREGLPTPTLVMNRWPSDPFAHLEGEAAGTQRGLAEAWVRASDGVAGSTALARLSEAHAALARLPAAWTLRTLPHLPGLEPGALVDALAARLTHVRSPA